MTSAKNFRRTETLILQMRRALVSRRRILRERGLDPTTIQTILAPMRSLLSELQQTLLISQPSSLH